jgi:hypothetical protein
MPATTATTAGPVAMAEPRKWAKADLAASEMASLLTVLLGEVEKKREKTSARTCASAG